MSNGPDDLLGKADALMARRHAGRTPAAPLPDLPVLDEIVDPAQANEELPLLTESVEPQVAVEEQVHALAAEVRVSLLADVQPKIDALIDQYIADQLVPLMGTALEQLRSTLQSMAREVLRSAIDDAVKQALDKRR